MKRHIAITTLCIALSAGAYAASAVQDPTMIYGEALSGVSPDGQWVAGQITDGSVIIRNLATGEFWADFASGLNNYYVGYGSPVSNIGVVAGSTTTSNAAYWEKGKWTLLPVPNRQYICNAVSITPDGSIICGGVGMAQVGADTESTMLFPALWYRQEDGTYGDPLILPHPELDLTGRAPQYISAIAVSDDGKTVAGEITDYFGARTEPIAYTCDANRNWTFRRLGTEMLNPNGIVFPEWPGGLDDDILMPTQEWYMTPEQIEAFVEAFNEWDNTGEPPRYEDFMTPEQIAEYRAALKEYYDIVAPWAEKYNEFMEVYMRYLNQGSSFGRNQIRLSPDGKICVTSSGGRPVVFNLETGETTVLQTQRPTAITCVTADYSILAYISAKGADLGTYKAYIYPQMQEGGMALEDYLKGVSPDLYEWMESHLYQDVIVGLNADGTLATETMMCTGIPVATPDMGIIVTNNSTASWIDDPGEEYLSLVLPTGLNNTENNAVEEIVENKDCEGMSVYDLAGTLVATGKTLDTDALAKGVYIVVKRYGDGTYSTSKICL